MLKTAFPCLSHLASGPAWQYILSDHSGVLFLPWNNAWRELDSELGNQLIYFVCVLSEVVVVWGFFILLVTEVVLLAAGFRLGPGSSHSGGSNVSEGKGGTHRVNHI